MKSFFRDNKILIAITCVIAILGGGFVMANRISIEKENKTYDIVLDYKELEAMAEQEGKDVSFWLSEFSKMGIKKIGLQEESVINLMEDHSLPVSGKMMDEVLKDASFREKYPQAFINIMEENNLDVNDVVVEMGSLEAANFVIEGLTTRLPKNKVFIIRDGEKGYALIDGTPNTTLYTEKYKYMNSKSGAFAERTDIESSKLMYISLGLLPEKVAKIQALGMEIAPRTMSYNGWNGTEYAKAVVAGYEKYEIKPEYMIVGGEAALGCDDGQEFIEGYMKKNGTTLGLIENTTQLQNIMQYGVNQAAMDSGYNVVRVFSVWPYIQNRYQYYGYEGAEEIENTLFRAVTERNIRLIYFKPIMEFKDLHTYVTEPSEYQKMFANLEARLGEHGIGFGSASVMKSYEVDKTIQMLLALGCVLAAVLLIRTFLPIRNRESMILAVLGILGAGAASYVLPNSFELILSFAAAVIFACLAITLYTSVTRICAENLDKNTSVKKIIPLAAATVAVAIGIAVLGGIMTAAPLSSTSYMLEIDIFRGVKFAQLLPIAFFAVAYLATFGYGKNKKKTGELEMNDLAELFGVSIKVWMILLGAVLGAVGMYYMMRTGHESAVQVSSLEMLFRNKLEDALIARPRSKEFLFAFPAVMMMVYCGIRGLKLWTILFGLGGVIGMTSVVNTFMHFRTPLYLGFARTGFSLVFGIALGAIAILIFEVGYKLCKKYIAKYFDFIGEKTVRDSDV